MTKHEPDERTLLYNNDSFRNLIYIKNLNVVSWINHCTSSVNNSIIVDILWLSLWIKRSSIKSQPCSAIHTKQKIGIITETPWTAHTPHSHDDVIKWKYSSRYWPFVRGIHRSPVNSQHKGQWRGALVFSLICAWINGWVNNREAGDIRRYRTHYDVIVMNHRKPHKHARTHVRSHTSHL